MRGVSWVVEVFFARKPQTVVVGRSLGSLRKDAPTQSEAARLFCSRSETFKGSCIIGRGLNFVAFSGPNLCRVCFQCRLSWLLQPMAHKESKGSLWNKDKTYVRFNIHTIPNLTEDVYKRAALNLKDYNNCSSIESGRTGILIVLREARNLWAASATFKNRLNNLKNCPDNIQWKITPHGLCQREPPDVSANRQAFTEDVCSGAADVEASATGGEAVGSATMMNICTGNVGLDSYEGLRASLAGAWDQNKCLGFGSYGCVMAFPMSRKHGAQPVDKYVAVSLRNL